MAEFGVEASGMSAPSAAGSTPHGGYESPQIRTDIWQGLEGKGAMVGQLVTGVANLFGEDKTSPILKELSNTLSSLSNARESGSIKQSEANAKARLATTLALGKAMGDPELTKLVKQNAEAFFGITSLGVEDEEKDFQKTLDQNVISSLQKEGFPVVANPDPDTMAAYREAYSKIQISSAELDRRAKSLSLAASTYDFDEKKLKKSLANDVNDFISTNIPTFNHATGQSAKDLKQKIERGEIRADAAIQTLRGQFDTIRGQMQMLAPASPDMVSSTISYINSVEKTLIDSLDPKVALDTLDNTLKAQIIQDRIFLSTDRNFRALQAIEPYVNSNPFMFQALSNITVQAMPKLVNSLDPGSPSNGIHLSDMASDQRSEMFGVGKDAIRTAMSTLQDVQSGRSKLDPKVTDNMINNLLVAGANIPPEARASASKEFVEFLASDEFKVWRQKGTLSPDALRAAQTMFDNQYLRSVQQPILNKLNSKLPTDPVYEGYKTGTVKKDLSYMDVLEVNVDGGVVNFSPKKIEGMDISQSGRARDFVNDVKALQKVINNLIVAGANVKGQSVEQYWEANKSSILPAFFPPSNPELKVGDVVNGFRYKGGSVKSESSWEKIDGGGE